MGDNPFQSRLTRRQALQLFGLAAGSGALLALDACTSTVTEPTTTKAEQKPTPTTEQKPAATSVTAKAPTVPTGTLTYGEADWGNESLYPLYWGNAWFYLFNERLLHQNSKGNLGPLVAESWGLSKDGLAWTFKLNPKARFSNGYEVSSEDIKWSIEHLASSKSLHPWRGMLRRAVDKVETPDKYTVVVHTKGVDAAFDVVLGIGVNVMSKRYFDEVGEDHFSRNPIGTSNWKFVEIKPKQSLTFEAVENHWRGLVPAFKTIVVKLIPEESTRVAMLKRGDVDIVGVSIDATAGLKNEGFDIRTFMAEIAPGLNVKAVYKNYWKDPVLDLENSLKNPADLKDVDLPTFDARVRQAMSLAINREEIAKTFFKGYAVPMPSASRNLSTYSWGYDPNWKVDPYDPGKAKQLLADAGYPGKFKNPVVTVYSTSAGNAPWLANYIQILAGYWEAVGVRTKIENIDSATIWGMSTNRPYDPKVIGTIVPPPGVNNPPNGIYHNQNAFHSSGQSAVFANPEDDKVFEDMIQTLDENERKTKYRKMLEMSAATNIVFYSVRVQSPYAMSKKVGQLSTAVDRFVDSPYPAFELLQHGQ